MHHVNGNHRRECERKDTSGVESNTKASKAQKQGLLDKTIIPVGATSPSSNDEGTPTPQSAGTIEVG